MTHRAANREVRKEPGTPPPREIIPAVEDVVDQLAQLLRANHGVDYCHPCLGALLAIGQDRVEAAMAILVRSVEFRADHWICFRCRQARAIVRAVRR